MPGNEHVKGAEPKQQRMYEHIKEQEEDEGDPRAKEIAARTVNKFRSKHGLTEKGKGCPQPKLYLKKQVLWTD
jgi:hypothetical protein